MSDSEQLSSRIHVNPQPSGKIRKSERTRAAILNAALNRLDAYALINAFGQRPRKNPKPIHEALSRIWISTLYGSEWLGNEPSNLVRT